MSKFSIAGLEKLGLKETSPGLFEPINKGKSSAYIESAKGNLVVKSSRQPIIKSINISPQISLSPPLASVLTIDGIVAGLNGDKGLMRSHWSKIKKQKLLYQQIIQQHLQENKVRKHEGQVSIEYIGYKSRLMDWDNFCSSFKHLGDSLVKMKIISDDNPKIVTQFIPSQIKSTQAEQKVVIIIKDK